MKSADDGYLRDIVEAIRPAQEWLVLGPSRAKLSLIQHIFAHERSFAARIVGVESVALPTDVRIAQLVQQYFGSPPGSVPVPH